MIINGDNCVLQFKVYQGKNILFLLKQLIVIIIYVIFMYYYYYYIQINKNVFRKEKINGFMLVVLFCNMYFINL